MSFAWPLMLLVASGRPAGRRRLRPAGAPPRAAGRDLREPGARAESRRPPARPAPSRAPRAGAARARRARDRPRAPARDPVGRPGAGDRGAGNGHLPLDGRDGRAAEPARGRASRWSDASSRTCRRTTASAWSRSRRARSTVLPATANRAAAQASLRNLRTGDGTALGEGIARAVQVAQRVPAEKGKKPPASILVLSDGAQTQGVLDAAAGGATGEEAEDSGLHGRVRDSRQGWSRWSTTTGSHSA